MIQTKVLTAALSGLQRLMEPNDTTRPSGSANSSVRANSSQLSRNAPDRRPRITDTKTHPSIFCTFNRRPPRNEAAFCIAVYDQSASASSYFSARALRVPSAFSASNASSTAAAASLPLRKATPYSSAFSSSTIFRSA